MEKPSESDFLGPETMDTSDQTLAKTVAETGSAEPTSESADTRSKSPSKRGRSKDRKERGTTGDDKDVSPRKASKNTSSKERSSSQLKAKGGTSVMTPPSDRSASVRKAEGEKSKALHQLRKQVTKDREDSLKPKPKRKNISVERKPGSKPGPAPSSKRLKVKGTPILELPIPDGFTCEFNPKGDAVPWKWLPYKEPLYKQFTSSKDAETWRQAGFEYHGTTKKDS